MNASEGAPFWDYFIFYGFQVGFINEQEWLHQVPFYPFQEVLIAFMNFIEGGLQFGKCWRTF